MILDEIGELPLAVQAKLLRFVEHKEIVPVGAGNVTLDFSGWGFDWNFTTTSAGGTATMTCAGDCSNNDTYTLTLQVELTSGSFPGSVYSLILKGTVSSGGSGPADADGDGVPDDDDDCAGTAAGASVDANGCADAQVDGDGDGVCDPAAPTRR